MPVDCPNCGNTNADGSSFCVTCGRALPALGATAPVGPAPVPPPQAPQPQAPQPQWQTPPQPQPQPQPQQWAPPPPPPGGYPPAPPGMAPGPYGAPAAARPGVNNNMAIAIVSAVVGLLCGCFGVVPGIVAVVMASQVNGKFAVGDVYGAQRSAKSARTWAIVAFIVAGTLTVMSIVLNAIGAMNFNFSTSS